MQTASAAGLLHNRVLRKPGTRKGQVKEDD